MFNLNTISHLRCALKGNENLNLCNLEWYRIHVSPPMRIPRKWSSFREEWNMMSGQGIRLAQLELAHFIEPKNSTIGASDRIVTAKQHKCSESRCTLWLVDGEPIKWKQLPALDTRIVQWTQLNYSNLVFASLMMTIQLENYIRIRCRYMFLLFAIPKTEPMLSGRGNA